MKTILKMTILAVLNAAIRRVQGTAPPSTAKTDTSMNTKTMRSTTLPEKSTDDAPPATDSGSSDGAPTAAGKTEEKAVQRNHSTTVAIMMKGNVTAAIAVDTGCLIVTNGQPSGEFHCVGMRDPRCKPDLDLRIFPTVEASREQFHRLLAMSRDNGWTIAHTGQRNHG